MGHKIEVNHASMHRAANELREQADVCRAKLRNITDQKNTIKANWSGSDSDAFCTKLEALNNSDSTPVTVCKRLDSLADRLDEAAKKYAQTQADAINRASWL